MRCLTKSERGFVCSYFDVINEKNHISKRFPWERSKDVVCFGDSEVSHVALVSLPTLTSVKYEFHVVKTRYVTPDAKESRTYWKKIDSVSDFRLHYRELWKPAGR